MSKKKEKKNKVVSIELLGCNSVLYRYDDNDSCYMSVLSAVCSLCSRISATIQHSLDVGEAVRYNFIIEKENLNS